MNDEELDVGLVDEHIYSISTKLSNVNQNTFVFKKLNRSVLIGFGALLSHLYSIKSDIYTAVYCNTTRSTYFLKYINHI